MFNRLETAAEKLSPWISRLRVNFRVQLSRHQMSGRTCYFGFVAARHARQVARRLQSNGMGIAYAVRGR